MRKHKTITISIPEELVEYLDKKIIQINSQSLEETNRSQYIRLLIKKDMVGYIALPNTNTAKIANESVNDMEYYSSLLQIGGYKR